MKVKECKIVSDGNDIFGLADGVKIAKRGLPGSPQAGGWVSIEPGWHVFDIGSGEGIELEYQGARVQ
jgi:hypothetical protein